MKAVTNVRNLRNGERYRYASQGHYIDTDQRMYSLSGPCVAMVAHLANLDTVEEQFDFLCFALLWENFNRIRRGSIKGEETPAFTRYMKLREKVAENPWIASAKHVVPADVFDHELFDEQEDLRLETVAKIFAQMGECEYVLYGYQLKNDRRISDDLLDVLRGLDPIALEVVVAELLKKMGYGNYSLTSKSVDGGVDIVFSEDPLGLHNVYVQVKRYSQRNQVTRREMQNFIGALDIIGGTKGIFVTTSKYYRDAYEVQNSTSKNIALIDGERLCELMISHGIGIVGGADGSGQTVDAEYFDVLANQSQRRLAAVSGRVGVWGDMDPSRYQSIWGESIIAPSSAEKE